MARPPQANRYWVGQPTACQLCEKDIVSEFVDGKTNFGPWAEMCIECHKKHGVGLGTGMGQRYSRQADGRWLKTGG